MNKHLVAIIKKTADKQELMAMIEYFSISKVSIILIEGIRINAKSIQEWFSHLAIEFTILPLTVKNLTTSSFIQHVEKFGEYQYIAIPVNNHRAFYKSITYFKKLGKTTIHISDGLPETFGLIGYCLTNRCLDFKDTIKTFYIFFEYLHCRADYCFHLLYPFKTYFAKTILPPAKLTKIQIPINILQAIKNEKVKTLLIPGWDETIDSLLTLYPDVRSFCATSKELFVNLNGKNISIEKFISAEDIINANLVKQVIGTASTGILYAKLSNPALDCNVVLNGHLNKLFSPFYEYFYRKKGKSIGINFICKK